MKRNILTSHTKESVLGIITEIGIVTLFTFAGLLICAFMIWWLI